MGQAIDVGLSGSCVTARRVFDADMLRRLHALNAASRRLRALGFAVDAEMLAPFDGGAPIIALRGVSDARQRVLLGMVSATTLHVNRGLRTAVLDGARLAWPTAVQRGE